MIKQGGQLLPLLYSAYADDLNYRLQSTGVGCYVRGACMGKFTELRNVVLRHEYAGPHGIVYNTTKTV